MRDPVDGRPALVLCFSMPHGGFWRVSRPSMKNVLHTAAALLLALLAHDRALAQGDDALREIIDREIKAA